MAGPELPKLKTWVRFPSPAPTPRVPALWPPRLPSPALSPESLAPSHMSAPTSLRSPLSVLAVGAEEPARGLAALSGLELRHGEAATARENDVVLLHARDALALAALPLRTGLAELAYDHAVVVAAAAADEAAEADLLRLGIEAVVDDHDEAALARALRHALVRKQYERAARTAYATDLATGLPHQAQLLEHMTQLLALREREVAPLVLIVLRIEGVAAAVARLGGDPTQIAALLRRKVAVRLRGGLRASDVVASLGPDLFAVLLGRVDAVTDGEGVAAKLLRAVSQQPFSVSGKVADLLAVYGLASYPTHGKDAATLLKRASAQAAGLATVGEQGVALTTVRSLAGAGGAANDEAH
jgi:GGDEF domain-containing protein